MDFVRQNPMLDKGEDKSEFHLQEEEVSAVLWMEFEKAIAAVNENTIPHCIYPEELLMVKRAILNALQ